MWVRKWERDTKKGVDSPIPTQVVSNEEFIPRPQTTEQRQWESLIGELSEEKSRKLGMERRRLHADARWGMATAFLASNMVYGQLLGRRRGRDARSRPPARRSGPRANTSSSTCRRTSPTRPSDRRWASGTMEFVQNMGFHLKNDVEAYSFPNYVKEIFFDSETSMAIISGVPGQGDQQGSEDGQGAGGTGANARHSAILPSWQMSQCEEAAQRRGQEPARPLPGQLCPQPLLEQKDEQARLPGPVRADGARGQNLRHR